MSELVKIKVHFLLTVKLFVVVLHGVATVGLSGLMVNRPLPTYTHKIRSTISDVPVKLYDCVCSFVNVFVVVQTGRLYTSMRANV